MKALYKCSFCEYSLRSDEKRKEHEETCPKNDKTEQERFEARKRLAEREKSD